MRAILLTFFIWLNGYTTVATAAPITYSMEFTSTIGPAPTSGGFTYDGSTNLFSSFFVQWAGITFDLTNAANSPDAGGTCLAQSSTSFALLSSSLACISAAPTWEAEDGIAMFQFLAMGAQGSGTFVRIAAFENPGSGLVIGSGTYSISSAVPEPASLILVGTSLLAMLLLFSAKNYSATGS